MADEADIADRFQELSLQAALAARANAGSKRELVPRGKCYNCDETLDPVPKTEIIDGKEVVKTQIVDGKEVPVMVHPVFCDAYCSEDWEKRKNRK